MGKIKDALRNRNFILIASLFLGLIWGGGARWTEKTILPALALVMTLSTIGVPGSIFLDPRKLIGPALAGIGLNFLFLGGFSSL